MLVVHPASLCDVCLDPYVISSEPANSPHAIACGHIFCLTCLRNLSPNACPLCRKTFQPDRVKKLHVAGPPELDSAAEETIETQASQLLQRVALASVEGVPDVEIIEVVTEVQEWLSTNEIDDDSHRPLRAALVALQSFKALQERSEREYAEYRRVRRELKAYRRHVHEDSKTSRAVEESLLAQIEELESKHAMELARLRAELDSLRGDTQQAYRNTSNPLPPPPEPLPLERFPPFARPGGAADVPDPLLGAVPYPPPPPRAQPSPSNTTNSYSSTTPYAGTSHTQYAPAAQITQPLSISRPRPSEAPRVDERSTRPSAHDVNGISHSRERRPRAGPNPYTTLDGRYASTEGRLQPHPGSARRNVPAPAPTPSPAPSWAHEPLVEVRSDEEQEARDARRKSRPNGTNGVIAPIAPSIDLRRGVGTRLASAEAYVDGYASGYDSGFQIASEAATSYAPSSYGSDRSERGHAFPVAESPDQVIGGLGLMGVPQPSASATVSTPDEDATPMNRARRLTRRNTTQAVETNRSTRRLGDHSILDLPPNGTNRRASSQTINQVLGVRRTATEGSVVDGGDASRLHRTMNRMVAPLAGENESPRSETTWGTVQTLSSNSFSGGSMNSLGMLLGLHNGGARGQGSVASGYIAHQDLGDNATSEEGEDDETETPVLTGSLPRSDTDISGLGLITEDEGDYPREVFEPSRSRHRPSSYSERNPSTSETVQDRQSRRPRRSEGNNDQRRHVSQPSTNAEAFLYDGHRAANTSDMTNALSLHFDASFPAHDYRTHTFSASGPEIVAPTPIVGGPNIIHLWANRT